MPLSDDQIDQVIETLETATEENNVSSARVGQVVHLPAEGEVWVTGDLHDHRRNFEKFVLTADLANNPQRHIVLHEMIHGEHFDENRAEDSWQMLFWAADLKCAFSSQVHFLFANHDLAQIHGEGIMKAGLSVCEAFNAGVKRDFGSRRAAAHVAVTEMLLSFPLAIRTANGLFISHSIPTDDQIPKFDYTVFDRSLTGEDYRRRSGAVYQLVWGRKMSPQSAGAFADRVGARILITGHQPQEAGFAVNGDRQIILASDHNQGVFLPLSLSETYEMDGIVGRVRRFVSLTLPEAAPDLEDSIDSTEPTLDTVTSEEAPPDPAPSELSQQIHSPMEASQPAGNAVSAAPAVVVPSTVEADPKSLVSNSSGTISSDPLPNERQRQSLCEMMAAAFVEIRLLGWDGKAAQAADLADAFHNVPREMYGWGTWSRRAFRAALDRYQQKYHEPGQVDHRNYATWFDRIMARDETVAAG
jgi:hypothetical protein